MQTLRVYATFAPSSAVGRARRWEVAAAAAALAAALAARYGSRPDAAARGLRVTTDLVTKRGAMDVRQALDAVGVRGVQVEGFDNSDDEV